MNPQTRTTKQDKKSTRKTPRPDDADKHLELAITALHLAYEQALIAERIAADGALDDDEIHDRATDTLQSYIAGPIDDAYYDERRR